MRSLTPRPAFAKREGSPWMWTSLGVASDAADWPLADRSAPTAKPANAAPCFRNRLLPDRLESMISSRDRLIVSGKFVRVSTVRHDHQTTDDRQYQLGFGGAGHTGACNIGSCVMWALPLGCAAFARQAS